MVPRIKKYSGHCKLQSWEGDRGRGIPPNFLPQMQFLQSFETIQLPNPLKLPELQLKFDDQIIGNHISKVPVFKISLGPFAQTPLDGLHL